MGGFVVEYILGLRFGLTKIIGFFRNIRCYGLTFFLVESSSVSPSADEFSPLYSL
jgi:hypothetical protein